MQRHLSTGSALVSAMMAAQRAREPRQGGGDVIRLLASLGERAAPAGPAMLLTPAGPAMRADAGGAGDAAGDAGRGSPARVAVGGAISRPLR